MTTRRRGGDFDDDYNDWSWRGRYFPPSTPIAVEGGIKARSKRGAFATQWWAKRWVAVLESFNLGARLQRGRSYARRGQVLSIDIAAGSVKAAVQGSRSTPYQIAISLPRFSPAERKRLASVLAGSPLHLAKLVGGEMPQDIEELLTRGNLSLFPRRASELKTECSCPDWSNPCKHIAAVYYLIGEEFDRDPFLLFTIRGITRGELMTVASASSPAAGRGRTARVGPTEPLPAEPPSLVAGGPIPSDFWEAPRPTVDLLGDLAPPLERSPLLDRLGPFPFWRAETSIADRLSPVLHAAAVATWSRLMGEEEEGSEPRVGGL